MPEPYLNRLIAIRELLNNPSSIQVQFGLELLSGLIQEHGQAKEFLEELDGMVRDFPGLKTQFEELLQCDEEKTSVSNSAEFIATLKEKKAPKIKKLSKKVSILFLSADPTDYSRLRIGEEMREIQEKLQLSKQRSRFKLNLRTSVRSEDISQAMLDLEPKIVHFSGHGLKTGALCFENHAGQMQPVAPEALAALFDQFDESVDCVLLNACYSEIQAEAISEHIEWVIGMNDAIGDQAALSFSIGFYQALGAGKTFEEAYKLGVVQIRLQGIPEHLTPVLLKRDPV